jgi:Holliday junction resolvase
MSNYFRGRTREYRIMHNLEKKGLVVFRTAGSHGVVDLIAINPKTKEIIFIQAKPKSMSKKAKERLEKANEWLNDEFIVSFRVISLTRELLKGGNKQNDKFK